MTIGFLQRAANDINGLTWLHKFNWLRSVELGRLLWKNNLNARNYADRVIRGWRERDLVITRHLPNGAGCAYVLSSHGANFLQQAKKTLQDRIEYRDTALPLDPVDAAQWAHIGDQNLKTGKSWGVTKNGSWRPPLSWRHDLLSSGALAHMFAAGFAIISEAQIRRENIGMEKIPDGLIYVPGDRTKVLWLEVERASKSGDDKLQLMANALCRVAQQTMPVVCGFAATTPVVAFALDGRDDRGLIINHKTRISNAITRAGTTQVAVEWIECTMEGLGVASIMRSASIIDTDKTEITLRRLNASIWPIESDDDENYPGCHTKSYGDWYLAVWDDSDHGWSATVEYKQQHVTTLQCETLAACQRACAKVIADRS